MIRASAFILLLATLGYLTETVRMPFSMARMAEKLPCCKEMKQEGKKCNPEGSWNNTANCSDCPLCYTATPAAHSTETVPYILYSTRYPITAAGMTAGYHTPSWKPPDT